ncbi:MAG: entericidin A/B family lipoprotein [Gallionella sp.]
MKKIAMLLMLAGILSACNTMEGIGKDLKQGGESIEKAASK